jgi:uncharacterized OB-fold protein
MSGECKLLTFTRVEVAPAAFKDEAPYVVGLAQFMDGPRVLAWVDRTIPESSMQVGARLSLKPLAEK